MQFLSENFSLNGVNSYDMNIVLVTFEEDIFRNLGNSYKQDLSIDSTLNNTTFYSNTLTEGDDLVLNFMLTTDDRVTPDVWDKVKLNHILTWIISDDFQPFISEDNEDVIYYIKCVDIKKMFTNEMTGYLECTFKVFNNSPYYMDKVELAVSGSGVININNVSNLSSNYKPIIKVTSTGSSNISLNMNSVKFTISGLSVGETVTIDNKMKTVYNSQNINKISSCNRKWLHLKRGVNLLEVVGNCVVEVISAFPISI